VKSLFEEDITAQTDKDIGMVTTAIGFSLSFFLALYKYEIGHKLQSLTITAGNQIDSNKIHSRTLVPTAFLLILTPFYSLIKRCHQLTVLWADQFVCLGSDYSRSLFLVGR
jgi:hypothetical protein